MRPLPSSSPSRAWALLALGAALLCLAWPTEALGVEAEPPKKATFAPVVEKTSGQVTTCGGSCELRDALLDSGETLSIAVRETGTTEEEVEPTGAKLVLQRQHDGGVEVVSGEAVKFHTAAGEAQQDRFTIDLSGVDEPSEYSGALLFDLSNGAEAVSVPVGLKVREGPLFPLLLLALMIGIGMLIRWGLDQFGATKFRNEARKLRARIAALPARERAVLEPLWTQVWGERSDDLAAANTHLSALGAGTEALRRARDAQDRAQRTSKAVGLTAWEQRVGSATAALIQAVRSFAASYDDKVAAVAGAQEELANATAAKVELDDLTERAKTAMNAGDPYAKFQVAAQELRTAIEKVSPKASEAAPDLEPLRGQVKSAFRALEEAHGGPLEIRQRGVAAGLGTRSRSGLRAAQPWPEAAQSAGMAEGGFSAFDLRAVLGGPLSNAAALGVMLVLLAIGFKVTYLDNATFGASLTDWLAVAIWGLAAYGARQTLTGLGPSPAPEKS